MAAVNDALFLTNNNYFTPINKAAVMLEYKIGTNSHLGQNNSNQRKQAYRIWRQSSVISHRKCSSRSRHHPNGDIIKSVNTYPKRRK